MQTLPSAIRAVLTDSQIDDLRLAVSHLTGPQRRSFQAQMSLKYCKGKPRLTKKVFGWCRFTVAFGLEEHCSGITCVGKPIEINLDNGPENSGGRTQFLNRTVSFCEGIGVAIH